VVEVIEMAVAEARIQNAPMSVAVRVTVAVLNYNGRSFLEETLSSIESQNYRNIDVILVDDGSTDDSLSFVRERFPSVRIFEMGKNTKILNKVRNVALRSAQTRFVFLVDNDIKLKQDCLVVLMKTMQEKPEAGVLTVRVMYAGDSTRIYIDRNLFHYVCYSIDRKRGTYIVPGENQLDEPRQTFGCGIQLIDRSKAAQIGYFDESFVMGWGDDGEFHHRMNLRGYPCYAVPRAVVYHEAVKGSPRVFGQLRNRWALLIESYEFRTIILILPALLIHEVSLLIFLILKGHGAEYFAALLSLFRSHKELLQKRREIQSTRVVADGAFMTSGPLYIPEGLKKKSILTLGFSFIDFILNAYWRLVRTWIGPRSFTHFETQTLRGREAGS
jgi:GT2 family glycosyltransferase